MRPTQHATTGSGDLFRARLERIINMKHELLQRADKIDWAWIDSCAALQRQGLAGVRTRFVIDLLLLKYIYGLPTKAYASAGCMIRISCNSRGKSSSR